MSVMLREALADLDRGFALLPVRGKRPATDLIRRTRGRPGWRQLVKRPATASEVHAWLEDDPTTGIGVLTGEVSGVAVFDVDVPALAPAMPTTARVTTQRGEHVYARIDRPVHTRERPWGSVRGEGAYVVAPCTRRAGFTYSWSLTPEDAGIADFAEFESGATATPIRTTCLKGTTCSDREFEGLRALANLECDERAALRLARALGAPEDVALGRSFACVLHRDESPSASLWRYEAAGRVLYHDFHAGKYDGARWLPLARVRALLAGRTQPLSAPELAIWKLRLAAEAELLEPVPFERLLAPSARLERVWQGFLYLVSLRWAITPGRRGHWYTNQEGARGVSVPALFGLGIARSRTTGLRLGKGSAAMFLAPSPSSGARPRRPPEGTGTVAVVGRAQQARGVQFLPKNPPLEPRAYSARRAATSLSHLVPPVTRPALLLFRALRALRRDLSPFDEGRA